MAISFDNIPATLRVPWQYIEFDNTGAIRGASLKAFKVAVFGQRLTSGTIAVHTPTRVTNADQAKTFFGEGSMLHNMMKTYFRNNNFTETWVIPVNENGSGVAASGSITLGGTVTAAGTLCLYIGGKRITVGVASAAVLADVAEDLVDAINAVTDLPVTAAVDGSVDEKVNITCRWKGPTGNSIDLRVNYNQGDETPSGLTTTLVAMASGATNPDMTTALSRMASEQYDVIVWPYTDATNVGLLKEEMATRWGPTVQKEGFAYSAAQDTVANLATLGNAYNTQFLSIMGLKGSPTPNYEIAAAYGANAAFYFGIDPARPLQTLELKGVLAPSQTDRFTLTENNSLLFDGIATTYTDASGTVRIQRPISTYRKNANDADDPSYLDMTTMHTLAYLRYDFRNFLLTKYPRHKLGNDGKNYGVGQAIITPSVAKAECVARYKLWESLGIVENSDAFKAGLVVERNAQDTNRLDFLLTPDLMNQFMVGGIKIKFLL